MLRKRSKQHLRWTKPSACTAVRLYVHSLFLLVVFLSTLMSLLSPSMSTPLLHLPHLSYWSLALNTTFLFREVNLASRIFSMMPNPLLSTQRRPLCHILKTCVLQDDWWLHRTGRYLMCLHTQHILLLFMMLVYSKTTSVWKIDALVLVYHWYVTLHSPSTISLR